MLAAAAPLAMDDMEPRHDTVCVLMRTLYPLFSKGQRGDEEASVVWGAQHPERRDICR